MSKQIMNKPTVAEAIEVLTKAVVLTKRAGLPGDDIEVLLESHAAQAGLIAELQAKSEKISEAYLRGRDDQVLCTKVADDAWKARAEAAEAKLSQLIDLSKKLSKAARTGTGWHNCGEYGCNLCDDIIKCCQTMDKLCLVR